MHCVQIGLIRLTEPNQELEITESEVGDMVYELNGTDGNQWSDWCEVGGRWSDLFHEERFRKHIWPNKMDHVNMVKVDHENVDLVIEALDIANEWREEEFSLSRKRFGELHGKEFIDDLLNEDVTLQSIISHTQDTGHSRESSIGRYVLKNMISMVDDEWVPDSKFFYNYEHIMGDGTRGWTSIVTDPSHVRSCLSDETTRADMLDRLNGYYIVVVDFHF